MSRKIKIITPQISKELGPHFSDKNANLIYLIFLIILFYMGIVQFRFRTYLHIKFTIYGNAISGLLSFDTF